MVLGVHLTLWTRVKMRRTLKKGRAADFIHFVEVGGAKLEGGCVQRSSQK